MSMSLPVFIGSERIGNITVSRRSKVPEEVNLYDWHIMLTAHQASGRPAIDMNNDPDEPLEHYYADGCLVLLMKVLEAAEVKV